MTSEDATISATVPNLECPICKSTAFLAFNGRANARCAQCLSVERNRLLWMILERLCLFRAGSRVLHMAPEWGLAKRFFELSGDLYHPCDVDPQRYKSSLFTVRPLDLCADLVKLPSASFDLIVHTHVLEHVRCDVEGVLKEFERILAPGGHHFLCVPIKGQFTREDLSESLTPEQRTQLFGQHDHYRVFGVRSFTELLARVWSEAEDPKIEPLELFSREALIKAAIPETAWSGYSGHSIFHHRRPL